MTILRDTLRGTGRTSRMIQDAICVAQAGKLVYIICDNIDQRKAVEKQVERFVYSNSIRVCEPQHVGEINWETLTIKGQASNTTVFVDHLVIENRLNAALDMLNRWNPDTIESVTPLKCSNMDNYKDWEINTPVWCNNNNGNGGWHFRYFAGIFGGRPYAWNDRQTSYNNTQIFKTEWDVMYKASDFSPAGEIKQKEERNKCIVRGCENHSDQWHFIGDLCTPCHTMITTGKILEGGKTFIHEMKSDIVDLFNKVS